MQVPSRLLASTRERKPGKESYGFGSSAPRYLHPHPSSVLLPPGEPQPGPATYCDAQPFTYSGPARYRAHGGPLGASAHHQPRGKLAPPEWNVGASYASLGKQPRLLHPNRVNPLVKPELVPGPLDYEPREWRQEAQEHVLRTGPPSPPRMPRTSPSTPW